jgi:hypothetical protein
VNDENGDLLADSRNILNRWKNYFSKLLSVHRISGVRQIEIIQLSLILVLLKLKLLLHISKGINRQVVIKLWKNLFK